jgi:hypothetical protein
MSALAPSPRSTAASFAVVVPAETGALERVLGVFTRAGHVPSRIGGALHRRSGTLSLTIDLDGIDADRADLIAHRLRGLPGLDKVFVSRP